MLYTKIWTVPKIILDRSKFFSESIEKLFWIDPKFSSERSNFSCGTFQNSADMLYVSFAMRSGFAQSPSVRLLKHVPLYYADALLRLQMRLFPAQMPKMEKLTLPYTRRSMKRGSAEKSFSLPCSNTKMPPSARRPPSSTAVGICGSSGRA